VSEEADWEAEQVADVLHWRRREALAAGLTRVEASLYAESEIGAEELRHLIELGCPKELLAKVLL
jgi:hypothetical protein